MTISSRFLRPRFLLSAGFAATLASAVSLHADEIRGSGILLEPRLSFGDDLQGGLRAGWGILSWEDRYVSLFLDGEARIIPEAVRLRQSPTLVHQYREYRTSIGPGLSAGVALTEQVQAAFALGVSHTDGNFSGSNREPESGWIGWGEVGATYLWSSTTSFGLALQYRPNPYVFPGRILLVYAIRFGHGLMP